jgi:hypothetical protein
MTGTTMSVDDAVIPRYRVGSGAASGSATQGGDFFTDTLNNHLWWAHANDNWRRLLDTTDLPPAGVVRSTGSGLANVAGNASDCVRVDGTTGDCSAGATVSCTDTGITDAYACTASPAQTSYAAGLEVLFRPNTANAGAATLNIDSLGAVTIKKVAGGITTDLADNDLRAGQFALLVYDGANFQVISQLGNAGDGGSSPATISTPIWPWGVQYGSGTAGGTLTANQTRFWEFAIFGNPVTVGGYAYSVHTVAVASCGAGSDSCGVGFAIYDSSCNIVSGSEYTEAAPTVTGTNGNNTLASPITLQPGVYRMGYSTNSTALQIYHSPNASWSAMVNSGAGASTYRSFTGNSSNGTGSTITMPSSCGTRSALTSPGTPGIVLLP